jgi:BirA family biotin operon repressor/biotin-[acetyl-CoA-carboxylase] ligase
MNCRAVDTLAIDAIRGHLATRVVGRHLHLLDTAGSTRTLLRELAVAGADEGTAVVLAETQNLYVSILLRPPIPLIEVPVFSFIGSLALTDAVWATGRSAWIKWPSDILVNGRKVAGCVVDVHARAHDVDHVILTAGITLACAVDVNNPLHTSAGSAAGGMATLAGHPIDLNVFTASLLNAVERWLTTYRLAGPRRILTAFRSRDALAGQEVCVCGEGLPYRGRAAGVDDAGYLAVETAEGFRRVTVGQITFAGDAATA